MNGGNFSAIFASSNPIENVGCFCCFCTYQSEIANASRARILQKYKLEKDSTIPCAEDTIYPRKTMSVWNGKVIWNWTEPKTTISEQGKAFTLSIIMIKCDCFITKYICYLALIGDRNIFKLVHILALKAYFYVYDIVLKKCPTPNDF